MVVGGSAKMKFMCTTYSDYFKSVSRGNKTAVKRTIISHSVVPLLAKLLISGFMRKIKAA